jgi:hypothetical protein
LWKTDSEEPTHVEQGVLTKAHAIWMYLEHLRARGVITADPLRCDNWVPLGWKPTSAEHAFRCENFVASPDTPRADAYRVFRASGTYGTGAAARRVQVVAYIDLATAKWKQRIQAWHSFLVQDVELPDGSHAILMDTSDYLNSPPPYTAAGLRAGWENWRKHPCWSQKAHYTVPGACGEINDLQANQISALLGRSKGARFFLMGHHPWNELRRDSVARLLRLLTGKKEFVTYLSGHTHSATATLGSGATDHWEINVASTTDWPMEYAKISYWLAATDEVRVEVRSAAGRRAERCPYGRSGDRNARDQERREMAYAEPEQYVDRALEAYTMVYKAAMAPHRESKESEVPDVYCSINEKETALDRVPDAVAQALGGRPTLQQKRRVLDDLAQCDRLHLRNLERVRQMETDCAAWASKLESDMNRGAERMRLSDREPETFRLQGRPGR